MTNSNYKQELLSKQSGKAGSWRQQVEACKHTSALFTNIDQLSKAQIMCIETIYSVKTLFVSLEIINAEVLQKSEELELCKI
jgi:hypothetical protein